MHVHDLVVCLILLASFFLLSSLIVCTCTCVLFIVHVLAGVADSLYASLSPLRALIYYPYASLSPLRALMYYLYASLSPQGVDVLSLSQLASHLGESPVSHER